MMLIPQMVVNFGVSVLFFSLIIFSLVTLFMVPFIPDFNRLQSEKIKVSSWKLLTQKTLLLTLLSIFLFQAANMGLYAFIVGLGKYYGLALGFISLSLGWAAWIGIIGSLLVIWLSTRFGLNRTLAVGIGLTALGTWALMYSENNLIWVLANFGVGITWAFVIPYLFSICAALDQNGQVAAMGGLASKLGLATGPVVTGYLLGEDNYSYIINVATIVIVFSLFTSVLAANSLASSERKINQDVEDLK